jgi:hypothetical protein
LFQDIREVEIKLQAQIMTTNGAVSNSEALKGRFGEDGEKVCARYGTKLWEPPSTNYFLSQ